MNNRQLMIQALDLIEDRLTTVFPVAVLSKEMGYSLYHFTRLFQAITGIAPGEYISRRRITETALEILRKPERSLQDISLDYNFNSYETFTRAFKRMLHTTPSLVRKRHTATSKLPLLLRLYEQDLVQAPMDSNISPQVVDFGEIFLQGPLVKVNNDFSVLTDTWPQLFSKVSTIPDRILPEKYYQVGFWPDDYESNGFSIMCACELKSTSITLDRSIHSDSSFISGTIVDSNLKFPIQILPPARYLKFIHKGRSRDISSTYKYIYGIWLPRTEYRISIPFEFEYYGEEYLGPDNANSVSEIYIPLELL